MLTLEQVQEWFKDEKNLPAFKEIAKSMGFESPEEIQGLKNKNSEILLKLKKANENIDSIYEKLKIIDIENLDEYIASKASNPDKKKPNDDIKQHPEFKRIEAELKKKAEREQGLEAALHANLKETALSDALEANGFKGHKIMLKQAFLGKAKVENTDGRYSVVIEDEKGIPLPANEFFKTFAGSDYGKQYIDKPDNSGGGAQGFRGAGAQGKSMPRTQFEQLDNKSQFNFVKDGGKVTD